MRLTDAQAAYVRRVDHLLPSRRRWDARASRTLRLSEAFFLRVPLHGATISSCTNGTYVPWDIDLDEECWEVLGLFLAEGSIANDGARRRLYWSFHPTDEQHLVDTVANYWKRLGVKVSIMRKPTSTQVSISSRILAAWFEHVLGAGVGCYTHRLPDAIWTASTDAKRALLRGAWAGDGSWSLVNRGPSVVLEYGTASPALADGMLRLLAELGVVARQKIGRTSKSTVDTYWLAISGADQIERCMWLLEPHERSTVQAQIDQQQMRIAPTGYRLDRKGTAWVRVVETTATPVAQDVWSVEVARNHTVVSTGGLVAHNCFPKDSRALLQIANNAGYRFDLLSGVLAVNDEQFDRVADKIRVAAGGDLHGATVAVLGLTFKARTDDLRDSPSVAIINRLIQAGATIRAFDPTVASARFGVPDGITICSDAYEAADGADVLAVLTEWDEFRWLDAAQVAARMAGSQVVDARKRRLHRFAPRRRPARARRLGHRGRQLRHRPPVQRRPPRRAPPVHARRARHHRAAPRHRHRCQLRHRPRSRQPRLAARLRDDAARDLGRRLHRHAHAARPRRRPARPVLPRVDQRGVRRPAGAPAARDLPRQRQLHRAAQLLRRGQALQRGAHHGVPPRPRPRGAHRAHLQHLRRAHAARRRPCRQHLRRAGAAQRADHPARRRDAEPQLLPRARRDPGPHRRARRRAHRADQRRQPR
ncbi:MAG: hypothetical protein HZB15_06355 [Actinobacteria bacterium]|nr:hypothetical protein [Actinomycetota bacterium]